MFRTIIVLLLLAAAFAPIEAKAGVTRGYFRKDGTYVAPHFRSAPNKFKFDNYSYNPKSSYKVKTYKPKKIRIYNSGSYSLQNNSY